MTKIIKELDVFQPGVDYIDGTYTNKNLTIVSGTAPTIFPIVDITVTGNMVTDVTLVFGGLNVHDNAVYSATLPLEVDGVGGFTISAKTIITIAENTSDNGSLKLPVGITEDRDTIPDMGYFRYNSTNHDLEIFNGTTWEYVGIITNNTGSFKLPVGITEDRDDSPEMGYLRYNSELSKLELYDGTFWIQIDNNDVVFNNTIVLRVEDNAIPKISRGSGVLEERNILEKIEYCNTQIKPKYDALNNNVSSNEYIVIPSSVISAYPLPK